MLSSKRPMYHINLFYNNLSLVTILYYLKGFVLYLDISSVTVIHYFTEIHQLKMHLLIPLIFILPFSFINIHSLYWISKLVLLCIDSLFTSLIHIVNVWKLSLNFFLCLFFFWKSPKQCSCNWKSTPGNS